MKRSNAASNQLVPAVHGCLGPPRPHFGGGVPGPAEEFGPTGSRSRHEVQELGVGLGFRIYRV